MDEMFTPLDTINALRVLGYYPPRRQFNLELWLKNFSPEEAPLAEQLASRILFFNKAQGEAMFLDAIHSLSAKVPPLRDGENRYETWTNFLKDLLITRVTGETPHDTDSGFEFQRLARTIGGFEEGQILSPSRAVEICQRAPRYILFVDDFLGSGEQIYHFWTRKHAGVSFEDIFSNIPFPFAFYCPLLATRYGLDNANCNGLNIEPVHILDDNYSSIRADSVIWRGEHPQEKITEFMESTYARAKFGDPTFKFGHHNLGLTVGLWNNIPDASIQILWDESTDWKPLIKRS